MAERTYSVIFELSPSILASALKLAMLVVGPRWPFSLVVTCRSAASPAVSSRGPPTWFTCTDKKENQIFLIYRKIQSGAVEKKSYMRKGFLIYE
jgi:hypothetical protein